MSSDASVINVSLSNLARQRYSQEEPLSDDQKIYLETKVKPKEIVIIIFMMLLWLFSIRRYNLKFSVKFSVTMNHIFKRISNVKTKDYFCF